MSEPFDEFPTFPLLAVPLHERGHGAPTTRENNRRISAEEAERIGHHVLRADDSGNEAPTSEPTTEPAPPED